jgi:hypothetical protein
MGRENQDLLELYAKYAVRSIDLRDLRLRAIEMLVADSDEQLFSIAACSELDTDCVRKHAEDLFQEKGYLKLSWVDVLRVYAVAVSRVILTGGVTEEQGAHLIARASQIKPLPDDFHELDTFRYASSELPDRRNEAEVFRRGIREEAARLVREVGEGSSIGKSGAE